MGVVSLARAVLNSPQPSQHPNLPIIIDILRQCRAAITGQAAEILAALDLEGPTVDPYEPDWLGGRHKSAMSRRPARGCG